LLLIGGLVSEQGTPMPLPLYAHTADDNQDLECNLQTNNIL